MVFPILFPYSSFALSREMHPSLSGICPVFVRYLSGTCPVYNRTNNVHILYFYCTHTGQDLRQIACYTMGTPSLHLALSDASD